MGIFALTFLVVSVLWAVSFYFAGIEPAVGGKLTEKYGWELGCWLPYRRFDEGITFFHFDLNWDIYDDDHCPRFELGLIVFNWTVLEFNIYNIEHCDGGTCEQDDEEEMQ